MAKFSYILLLASVGIAAAVPQRNLQYPTTTTRRPGPNAPTTQAPLTTTTTAATTTTTGKPAPYAPAGFRPGRAFNLPTEEKKAAETPSPSYGPPADKYGPPEDATTTVQPELDETTTQASARIPNDLKPGFYFIQLPGGGIQKIALLTNAALVEDPVIAAERNTTDDVEEVTEPATAAAPTSQHVQPIAKTQRTVEVWPAPPAVVSPVVEVKPVVVESARIVEPARSQRVVAVEPVVLVQPKSYAFSSQFRTW